MTNNQLELLQARLGVTFEDRQLLRMALTHRSYLNEKKQLGRQSYERLEFLGDAVLSLIVAAYLYRTYPERPEGELTDLRSALVRRETLAKWAIMLDLGNYLLLGHGDDLSGGRGRALTLASAFEAVLGAIFVEKGLQAATDWLEPIVVPELVEILADGRHHDFKGLLQKASQRRFHREPHYFVMGETGLEHEKVYVIEARLGETVLGTGSGLTKQVAQQAAARDALARFENLDLEVEETKKDEGHPI